MIESSQVIIEDVVVHHIGAKAEGQPVRYSKNALKLQDEELVGNVLKSYFFNAFKTEAYFNFIGAEEGAAGKVYQLACEVFDDSSLFYNTSLQFAEFLHEQSNHPKIRGGEFYLALFRNCVVDGEVVDGLGLFKSENKETFLKVYLKEQNFELGTQEGINIRKLDKGCIIFNTEREQGFKCVMVDNINKGNEARFWKEDFLGLQPREDSYYFTQNYMDACKGFVKDVYNNENQVSRPEQFDFLNRSLDFFDNKPNFKQEDFEREVVRFPEVSEAFADYRQQFEQDRGIPLNDSFDISKSAVKSEKKHFKSVLKLDKNFHVYVHGKRDYIEKGFDSQKGMNYYKLFFEQEL
ncbi:nucleoid-associated protein [Natronoflexus pectinivorans]|uniref:Nucleoid associated protein NdpA n=1 Tax=Natronoflexus pectinivorans TaxID=682526 RepID=A0A4V2RWS3_9BACT|nr:nucleoid-associated protein [Natronoflexus pectinivorans]TCO09821.1 nucleoid associated protein NdpA [Natronoflexus pectinivorans]